MKTIKIFITYIIKLISSPKEFSEALNKASSPEELDRLVLGDDE